MALLEQLPLELKLKIGYMLDTWETIHSYTSVVWILRKCLDYAKFARKYYEKERFEFDQMEAKIDAEIDRRFRAELTAMDISRRLIPIGDDRIRYYRNPLFDDRTVELWRVSAPWIDYECRFYEEEITDLTWIYLPYGQNFNGKEFKPTIESHIKLANMGRDMRHISVVEIMAAFRQNNIKDTRIKMKNWIQRKNKKRYDNLFARMIFKEMIKPKMTDKDYNLGEWEGHGLKAYCEQASFRIHWDKGIFYQRQCYPWINEFDERIQQNVRGRMKRKYHFGEEIDIRDFLEK